MKTVDLFAGCGGLSLGFQKAGFNIVAAYENWAPAHKIYSNNFSHNIHLFDLAKTNSAIKHVSKFKPDIIIGGPPCQDFSSAGKRDENGGRGNLTISFADIVLGVKPEWFVMENVERIKQSRIFAHVKKMFSHAKYGLTEVVLDASLCGVPQKRKRMFLIGRLEEKGDFLGALIQNRLSRSPMTVREYFGEELNTNFYYRHPRSYARRAIFSIDEPSPTIRGVNRPIPPDYQFHLQDATKELDLVRPLSSFERARIQTFPNNFNWNGINKSTLEQIIGNAVPVNLAHFVGCIVKTHQRSSSKRKSSNIVKKNFKRSLVTV